MRYFNYNGKILAENTPVAGAGSRALRYGDGLFETLKFHKGQAILADDHFARLWKGMAALKFDIPKLLGPEKLLTETASLLKKNQLQNARVRIGIYRGDGGLYDLVSNLPSYIIEVWPLPAENARLNENGLQVCIYKDAQKNCDSLANLKHNNFLPYLMAAFYARENKCNDALLLNNHLRVADSSIANIFLLKDCELSTPPLSEGCVAGVMRKFILSQSLPGITISEKQVTVDDLLAADELFLSNSIYNIRWIGGLENQVFANTKTREIDAFLRQTNPALFC